MIQFCTNKTEIPAIEDMPSLGFGIMHRNYCHSEFLVDTSSAEDSLKARLLESRETVKFVIGKGGFFLTKARRDKRFLKSPGRWKIGRTKILIPSVANDFELNLKRRKQRELATFISTIIYYTHILGDYIVGAQGPLPEYRDTISSFQNDLHGVHGISIKDKIKIRNFFCSCSFNKKPKVNAQKILKEMGNVFPGIIMFELRVRKSNTYHKLKNNKKVAAIEIKLKDKRTS
ncbi:MAG: hypothetical protein JJE21_02810 [Spirochaetaceae bacterium]|nr:hypothetical protein [Spirochaetaceae bacterium]